MVDFEVCFGLLTCWNTITSLQLQCLDCVIICLGNPDADQEIESKSFIPKRARSQEINTTLATVQKSKAKIGIKNRKISTRKTRQRYKNGKVVTMVVSGVSLQVTGFGIVGTVKSDTEPY